LATSRRLALSDDALAPLRTLGDPVDLDQVRQVYLPLTELINLYIASAAALSQQSNAYLGLAESPTPFVIGIAGSVAVGKSTVARLLRQLLSTGNQDLPARQVDLITTDGFLYPNATLEKRGLMDKKGFPESYDQAGLLRFVMDVKSGLTARSPLYSHMTYDIVPGGQILVERPDILIIEGLNVLQPARRRSGGAMGPVISDFFDFSVYVDAPDTAVKQWFLERFEHLRQTAFADPASYFRQFVSLSPAEALAQANHYWDDINGPNLERNIKPTRERATVVIGKTAQHDVGWIRVRRV